MSAVSGTSAHEFEQVQEIQPPSVQKCFLHDLCRSAQSRSGDHKTHVKIGCALHNGCRQMLLYVPFSFCYSVFWVICWSLDVYMSDLSYLVQGESSPCSVGRPFCVHEFLPLLCDVSFDLTDKTIVLCHFFSSLIFF